MSVLKIKNNKRDLKKFRNNEKQLQLTTNKFINNTDKLIYNFKWVYYFFANNYI